MELAHVYFNLGMDQDGAPGASPAMQGPPVAAGVARAIDCMIEPRLRRPAAYAEAQYAADRDPFWPTVIGHGRVYTGDNRKAIEQVRLIQPGAAGARPPDRRRSGRCR